MRGLRESGFTEGQHVLIDYRWADGRQERLDQLAAELLSTPVSVFVAADTASALVAKRLAPTTPLVFFGGGDPVKLGLVASLNRPVGNATGVTLLGHTIIAKRLDILREISGSPDLVAYVCPANNPSASDETAEVQTAARKAGQAIQIVNVQSAAELRVALDGTRNGPVKALLIGAGPVFTNNRQKVVELVNALGLPAI